MKTNYESRMLFQASNGNGGGGGWSSNKEHVNHKKTVWRSGPYGEEEVEVECLLCNDEKYWAYVIPVGYGYGYADFDGDGYADPHPDDPYSSNGNDDYGSSEYDPYGDGYDGGDGEGEGEGEGNQPVGDGPKNDPTEEIKPRRKDYKWTDGYKPNDVYQSERSWGVMDQGCYLRAIYDKVYYEDNIVLTGAEMENTYKNFVIKICNEEGLDFETEWEERKTYGINKHETNDFYKYVQQTHKGLSGAELRDVTLCEDYESTLQKILEGIDMGIHIRMWEDITSEGIEERRHAYSIVGREAEGNGIVLKDPQTGNSVIYRVGGYYATLKDISYDDDHQGFPSEGIGGW